MLYTIEINGCNMEEKFNKDIDHKESWWLRASINAGIIGGLAFGITKVKGPTGRIIESIKKEQTFQEATKQLEKMSRDSFDFTHSEADMSTIVKSKLINSPAEVAFPNMRTEQSIIKSVTSTENAILKRGARILDPNPSLKNDSADQFGGYKMHSKAQLLGDGLGENFTNRSTYFDQLRHETLLDFLSRQPYLSEQSGPTFSYDKILRSIGDKNSSQLRDIHTYYLINSAEYAKLYRMNIKKVARTFWKEGQRQNLSTSITTTTQFKDFIQNGKFDSSALAEAKLRATKSYGGTVGSRQGTTSFDLIAENKAGLLEGKNRWMSKSHKFKNTGNKMFDQIGQFDYTGHFKDLANTLSRLTDDATSPIKSANLFLEHHGDAQYAIMNLTLEGQEKSHRIAIPISRDGYMPGKTRSATPRYDAFFFVGDELGLRPDKALTINKTQDILRKITLLLDSSFANKLADNPAGAIKQMQNIIMNQVQLLPAKVGEKRDIMKLLAVRNDGLFGLTKSAPGKNIAMKQYIRDAVQSAKNMKKIVEAKRLGRKAVGIGFDLETLGFGNLGPSAQASDPKTQVHTSSVSTIEFSAKGHVVTNTENMVSDHVIKYFNTNNGWEGGSESNIEWIKRLLQMPGADDETAKAAFAKYIKNKAANNNYRSLSNDEYLRKVAKNIISKIEQAADDGSDVFFITKNGTQFDLRFLERHAPIEYAKIRRLAPHIDLHSIAYWRKASTYGKNNLGLKSLLQKLLGEVGMPSNVDIDVQGGSKAFFDSVRKAKVNGYSLLDFSAEMEQKIKDLFAARAHESPDVDNIGGFALLSKWISEAESGASHFSTAHLSELGRFAAMGTGPLSLDQETEILGILQSEKTQYGHVGGHVGLSTSNMTSKGILSMLDLPMMLTNPNVPGNKQWDQLYRGVMDLSLNRKYKSSLQKGMIPGVDRMALKNPFITDFHHLTDNYFRSAGDNTEAFSKSVTLKHFFISNSWAGREGMVNISESTAKQINVGGIKHIDLTDITFNGMPVLSNTLREFRKSIYSEAVAIAQKRTNGTGAVPTWEDFEQAGKRVVSTSAYSNLEIKPNSSMGLAEGDFGVRIAKAELGGKIIGVSVEESIINPKGAPVIKAQIEFLSSLDKVQYAMYRSHGMKAVPTISDNMAYGANVWGTGDFIEKGYGGAAQTIITQTAIDNFRRKVADGGAEGKIAQQHLDDLALKLQATFTGNQMIKNTMAAPKGNFKNATSAIEKAEIAKYIGNSHMGFIELLDYVKKSGQAWGNAEDLARGYYEHWVGWKGTAQKTIADGRKFLNGIITKEIAEEFKDINDSSSEIGMLFKHFTPEGRNKIITDTRIIKTALLLPKEFGAKLYEFRTPSGDTPSKGNHKNIMLGMYGSDTGVISGINEGKAIRHSEGKIRGPILQNLKRSKTLTHSTILELERNQRYNYNMEYREAFNKLKHFKDALMGKALMNKDKHLNLTDINKLLDRSSTIALGDEPSRVFTDQTEGTIRAQLKDMMKLNNIPEEEVNSLIDEMIEDLTKSKITPALANNKKWMSTTEVQRDIAMARKYANITGEGVYRVSTGLEDGLIIDYNKIQQLSNEKTPLTATQIDDIMLLFEDILKDTTDAQGVTHGIVKKVINKQDVDGKWIKQVHLNQIVLPAADRNLQIAHRVTNNLHRRTDLTDLSKELFSEVTKLDYAIKHHGDSETSKTVLGKKFTQLILNAVDLHHTSLFGGTKVSAPAGLIGPAKGGDVILMKAWEAKNTMKNLTESQTSKLDALLMAKSDTVFLARSHLESVPIRVERNGTWETISYAKHLEEVNGKGSALTEEILSGRKAAPGYNLRYPLEQLGSKGVIDNRVHSLDEEMLGLLGIDKNGIYTLYHSENQKVDYDADEITIMLKTLSVTDKNLKGEQAYHYIMADHNEQLRNVLLQPDVYKKNTTRILNGAGLGAFNVVNYDEFGEPSVERVEYGSTKHMAVAQRMVKSSLAKNIAIDQPEILTTSYVRSRAKITSYNALMKTQIGVATNMIGRKMNHIAQAGKILKPHVSDFLLGNISFGLPNVNQQIMAFGKNPEEAAAKISKVMVELGTAGKMPPSIEGRKIIKDMFLDSMKTHADTTTGLFEGRAPEYFAEEVTSAFYNTELATHIATGGDRAKTAILRNNDNRAMGARGGSIVGEMISERFSFQDAVNRTVYRNLVEAGQYIDPSMLAQQKPLIQELGEQFSKKFNISDLGSSAIKKAGKAGAIGAAVFLGLNLIRPNQMSDSMNPLDGFIDLGADVGGNRNRVMTNVQLDRRLPIDMVNASFSNQAFIKMQNKDREADTTKEMSSTIKGLLGLSHSELREYRNFGGGASSSYTNYTSNIGYFGSSNLQRRSKL